MAKIAKKRFFEKSLFGNFGHEGGLKSFVNIQSCSASKILALKWSQILDISKNVDTRGFTQKSPIKPEQQQPTAVDKGNFFFNFLAEL